LLVDEGGKLSNALQKPGGAAALGRGKKNKHVDSMGSDSALESTIWLVGEL
jgi:hypothetical protein